MNVELKHPSPSKLAIPGRYRREDEVETGGQGLLRFRSEEDRGHGWSNQFGGAWASRRTIQSKSTKIRLAWGNCWTNFKPSQSATYQIERHMLGGLKNKRQKANWKQPAKRLEAIWPPRAWCHGSTTHIRFLHGGGDGWGEPSSFYWLIARIHRAI
jgi:hypothetical protein